MTTTLRGRAAQAADDLRVVVASRPIPSDGFVPRRPQQQRRVIVLAAVAIAVVLVTSLVAVIGHDITKTSPADSLEVPSGYKAVTRPAAGFAVAVPSSWVDGPPVTDISAPLNVLAMHDPSSAAALALQAQDIGALTVEREADTIIANLARTGVTGVTKVPDSSTGTAGFRLEWEHQGHVTAYVFKGVNDRRYTAFFHDTSTEVMTTAMHSVLTFALPPLDELPRRQFGAAGFTLRLPASWGTQPAVRLDANTEDVLIATGIEGTAIVTRVTDTHRSLQQAADNARQLAPVPGAVVTSSTLAGRPAVELTYMTTLKDPRFVTAPGFRRQYFVMDGADIVSLNVAGSNSARTSQLLDQIAASFKLTP